MTPQEFSTGAGYLISFLLIVVPVLSKWYDGNTGPQKALIFLGLSLAWALIGFGLACAKINITVFPVLSCTSDGFWSLVNSFIGFAIGGAGGYVSLGRLRPDYAKAPAG